MYACRRRFLRGDGQTGYASQILRATRVSQSGDPSYHGHLYSPLLTALTPLSYII